MEDLVALLLLRHALSAFCALATAAFDAAVAARCPNWVPTAPKRHRACSQREVRTYNDCT